MNRRIFLFVLVGIFVIGCASCGTKKAGSENIKNESSETGGNIDSEMESKGSNISETEEVIQWDNTYTSNLMEVDGVLIPTFSFDYSDNWEIYNEEIGDDTEIVELINENGIQIQYTYMASSFSYGDPRYEVDVDISRIADSCFVPSYAQTKDYSNLGRFAVVQVESDSQKVNLIF